MKLLIILTLWLIVYNEILPTISALFELARTWIVYWISDAQYKTALLQDEISETQERNQPRSNQVIGFQLPEEYDEEEDYV